MRTLAQLEGVDLIFTNPPEFTDVVMPGDLQGADFGATVFAVGPLQRGQLPALGLV